MRPDLWPALAAAALLVAAALVQGLAWAGDRDGAHRLAAALRAAAAVALAAALLLLVLRQGRWTPGDLGQVALGLALSAVVVHVALAARRGAAAANPVADLLGGGLCLVLVGLWPVAVLPSWLERALLFGLQGALSVLGTGALAVAGGFGLALAVAGAAEGRGRELPLPPSAALEAGLELATALGMVILGGGLVLGSWWTWQSQGSFLSSDPRQGWLIAAWLLAAVAGLARRLPARAWRWAAVLAVAAAAAGVVGMLAAPDLQGLFRA